MAKHLLKLMDLSEKEITEIVYRPRPEPPRHPDAWDYPVVAVGNGVTTAEIKW